ncbi:carbohydrate binding domain-containing protein [Streptacidiphilus sp. MAP5-52]|uniref:carbohydrate binding domain-containing protein n=1 Tax=Streptacidiphilus sp. MAP5-52 TaxID=3156267 RepID=UPI003515BF7D
MSQYLVRRLRVVIVTALLAMTITLPATIGAAGAHAAAAFTLFDNTNYNNDNLPANYGLTPSAVVYDSWNITCQNTSTYACALPPQGDFQAKIRSVDATAPTSSPLTLDFENIDITSGTPVAQATNDCQAWQTLISWARAVIPAAQPLGNYSYDWSQSSEGTSCNTTLHSEAGGLTFFAPSMYTYTDDLTGSDWTSWTTRVTQSVANDNAIAPSQPIYPYVLTQWDDVSGNDYSSMPASDWSQEIDYLQTTTQGAIIWSKPGELGSTSCGWIGATHNFMTALTGTGGSTGSLTADVQFPNTCTLTRGQTTAVPVTITNNGTTTSTATTLTVSGSTGITGTASPSAVPALAAGGTWSTTVDMTVGSNANLGDTVITYTLAGEGVQNRTALIQDPDLALNRTATQSSTAGSDTASLAVDGLTHNNGSTATNDSETNTDAQAWWQVDLGSSQSIGGIDLYAGANSATNFYLIVSNSASPAVQTTPLPPNQWIQTTPGTWVMNVYNDTFRYPVWKGDTDPRGMVGSTDVPVQQTGRYVRVQLAGTGQLSLDQVDVTPGLPDGAKLLSTDVVANGGFETGSPAPWTGAGTTSIAANTDLGGNYALQLSGTGSTVEQIVTVKPNTTYTLSGYAKVSASGNQVEIGVKNYGGSQAAAPITATGWTQGTVTFTTGASTTTADIFCYHDIGSGTANCDDITAYPAS